MELTAKLRERGYRLTPQRQLVLDAIAVLGHATPEDVYEWVQRRSPGVNISTVYRTLELLEELGCVRHAHLSHGAPTYHDADAPQHAHLVCRRCGDVSEMTPQELAQLVSRLRRTRGFALDVGHLTIFGDCTDCAQLAEAAR